MKDIERYPNFEGQNIIRIQDSGRRGRLCLVPPINNRATQRVKTLQEKSLTVLGPRLYNCLPADVRCYEGSMETFKVKVDRFLKTVPDRPCLPHYYQSSTSNSIWKQVEQMRADSAVNRL